MNSAVPANWETRIRVNKNLLQGLLRKSKLNIFFKH